MIPQVYVDGFFKPPSYIFLKSAQPVSRHTLPVDHWNLHEYVIPMLKISSIMVNR